MLEGRGVDLRAGGPSLATYYLLDLLAFGVGCDYGLFGGERDEVGRGGS